MTETEARARLERMVAPTLAPVLSYADVSDLMSVARRPDINGVLPSETGWVPTWDLDAAAAAGWEIKAGRVASEFAFSEDGQSFRREQVHAACLNMAKLYRRGTGSVLTQSVIKESV